MRTAINCPECGKKTEISLNGKTELTLCKQDLIWASIFKCDCCHKYFSAKLSYTPVIEVSTLSFQKCNQE